MMMKYTKFLKSPRSYIKFYESSLVHIVRVKILPFFYKPVKITFVKTFRNKK